MPERQAGWLVQSVKVDPYEGDGGAGLPSLDIQGARLVQPQYAGQGLANVGSTVLALLANGAGADADLLPLDERTLPHRVSDGARNVVLLVADGLGYQQLLREVEAGHAPTFARLIGEAATGRCVSFAPITSVFPSTTVSALGALNTATTPARHGLLGYTLNLEELGGASDMIRWGPLSRTGTYADDDLGGHIPEKFLWAPTLYQRLAQAGVSRTFAVNPRGFAGTSLTRMLHQGAEPDWYVATSAISVAVRRLLDASAEPTYVFAYWPTVDTVAHVHGPLALEHAAEVAALDLALSRLVDALPRRGDTLVMVTADHGHIATTPRHEVLINDYPDVASRLAVPVVGERRAAYLHAMPGQADALLHAAREQLADRAVVLSRNEAFELGLYGPAPRGARAEARIGDVLLLPRDNLQVAYRPPASGSQEGKAPPPKPPFRGMHGGLAPQEMLVPLLALRV